MRGPVQNLGWLAFYDTMIQNTQNVCQELKVQLQPLAALHFVFYVFQFHCFGRQQIKNEKIIQKAGIYKQDFTFEFKQEVG